MGDSSIHLRLATLVALIATASAAAGPTTVEQENGEGPNSFRFDDAFNVFAVVEDEPSGFPGATADENLTYEFAATGILGGSDNSLAIQGTPIPPMGASVTPDADGTLDFEDVLAEVTDPVLGLLDYTFTNAQGAFAIDDARVINASAVTLTVTNSQGAQSSNDFMVYTVTEAPDAVSGAIPVESSVVDLSQWTYVRGRDFGTFAEGFRFDPGAVGTMLPDDDADGSGVDLQLAITDHSSSTDSTFSPPWSPYESMQFWYAPIGIIPFAEGKTTRVRFTIRAAAEPASPTRLVEARVRWFYGAAGHLGSGNVSAHPRVNRPTSTGTEYRLMFDHLDVASANDPTFFDASANENDVTLAFEAIDLFQNYGGAVELERVVIDQLDRAAVSAEESLFFAVSDFRAETQDISFGFGAPFGSATASATADQVFLVTPVAQPGIGFPVWGDLQSGLRITLTNAERALIQLPVRSESGLIYRAEFRVDSAGNSLATPLAPLILRLRTVDSDGIPRDTSESRVESHRQGNTLNPAYQGIQTYSVYHHFPSGFVADGVDPDGPDGDALPYGSGIGASIALPDFFWNSGGAITLTQLEIFTIPEALLP